MTPPKHHDIRASDPLHARPRPTERVADGDSPYGADVENERRAAEREQDRIDGELLGKAAGEGRASPLAMHSIRDLGISAIMHLEGCTRDAAIAIIDAPQAKPRVETPGERTTRIALEQHARLRAWLKATGIPVRPEMVDPVLRGEHLHTDATRGTARWYRDPNRRVLALIGPTGVGKTVAAALVATVYAKRHERVRYLREPALVKWSSSSTLTHEARVEELHEADLLIVDELGTTLSTQGEKARDAMFAMLDDRLAREARTILIGNLCETLPSGKQRGSADALGKAYGGRFMDRLREVGVIVELHGESMRGRS